MREQERGYCPDVLIMGPSGSGKTTLLNLISGVDQADEGRIEVAGVDITERSEDDLAEFRLRHVGFVVQFYNLVQVLTAFQNVELPLLLARLPICRASSRAARSSASASRAIVTDPTLTVADEPTGDLDRESADHILALLRRLNEELGKTIVMGYAGGLLPALRAARMPTVNAVRAD
jgi:putative ABC transport system ATP-binding protein